MTFHSSNNDNRSNQGKTFLAFIAGAATAVAVGGYLLFGPKGAQNRQRVEHWLKRAKVEILDKMEKAGDVSEDQYHRIVDEVMGRYGQMKEVGSERAARASERFKQKWGEMKERTRRAREEAERELDEEERL